MAQRIVILGGHGKVAQLLTPKLKTGGFTVDAVIRDPDQRGDIESAGGHPVVLNMETASIDDFAELFAGATAIVFAAGAGGGNPKRTRAVDFEAATRTMEAAEKAGVKRYIMVSYARAADHYKDLGSDHSFYPYAKAKHDADAYLRKTNLDYTIVGPGLLTLEPTTRKLQIADARGQVDGDWPDEKKVTSRDNVAEVIAHLVQQEAAVHRTVNFEAPRDLRRHPDAARLTWLAAFAHLRARSLTDDLVDLLVETIHRIGARAERKVERELLEDLKRVSGKQNLLFNLADATLAEPDGVVRDVVFPVVGEQTLRELVNEWKATGPTYRVTLRTVIRNSYRSHYRRMVPTLLAALEFRCNNDRHRPVMDALDLVKRFADTKVRTLPAEENVPLDGVARGLWREAVMEKDASGEDRINRITYEIAVLEALRERLRCKEIWVVGANRYRNPDEDLPADFDQNRENYYQALSLSLEAEHFIVDVQAEMREALSTLDAGLKSNPDVRLSRKSGGWITLTPLDAQSDPPNLTALKAELNATWPMTSLLDIIKEADLRLGFTNALRSPTAYETMNRAVLQPRLLLCLHGLGTNAGLQRMASLDSGLTVRDLAYVRRRYISVDAMRRAIAIIADGTLAARNAAIWGSGTTACASDSKHFGAWDQNLTTQWHVRYGGRGIMIYWHVERHSLCIHSQLKSPSSSEVASMIEGVLHHCTEMEVDRQYVDSHGQSTVAFAFCQLLGFQLLPRLKAIHAQRLYRPETGEANAYANLQQILSRPIDWALIRQQYDEMVKYATALRLGTAETEAILRRFTRKNLQHPTYKALAELGRAVKTTFLCRYLHNKALRREINEGLNVIEQWNGATDFVFFARRGELASNQRENHEISMLALHLIQNCMVYINTLMIQDVLAQPHWQNRFTPRDYAALTPLIWEHVNPYGRFDLDMNTRLDLS